MHKNALSEKKSQTSFLEKQEESLRKSWMEMKWIIICIRIVFAGDKNFFLYICLQRLQVFDK